MSWCCGGKSWHSLRSPRGGVSVPVWPICLTGAISSFVKSVAGKWQGNSESVSGLKEKQ